MVWVLLCSPFCHYHFLIWCCGFLKKRVRSFEINRWKMNIHHGRSGITDRFDRKIYVCVCVCKFPLRASTNSHLNYKIEFPISMKLNVILINLINWILSNRQPHRNADNGNRNQELIVFFVFFFFFQSAPTHNVLWVWYHIDKCERKRGSSKKRKVYPCIFMYAVWFLSILIGFANFVLIFKCNEMQNYN